MATFRQKRAVQKMVEASRSPDIKKSKGELLIEAGYSPNTSLAPTKVTESSGFKKELASFGLTEELVTKALVDDIIGKPRKRFLELSLGADILGMKKRETPQENHKTVVAVQIIVNGNNAQNRTDGEAISSA